MLIVRFFNSAQRACYRGFESKLAFSDYSSSIEASAGLSIASALRPELEKRWGDSGNVCTPTHYIFMCPAARLTYFLGFGPASETAGRQTPAATGDSEIDTAAVALPVTVPGRLRSLRTADFAAPGRISGGLLGRDVLPRPGGGLLPREAGIYSWIVLCATHKRQYAVANNRAQGDHPAGLRGIVECA